MRSDLDSALVEEAMRRYLTPAQRSELARLFADCVREMAENRAARLAAGTDGGDRSALATRSAAR